MTQDEIIEMARQTLSKDIDGLWLAGTPDLEAFAKLVRNHYSYTHAHLWLTRIEGAVKAEREACAKDAEWCIQNSIEQHIPTRIRARAQADRGKA